MSKNSKRMITFMLFTIVTSVVFLFGNHLNVFADDITPYTPTTSYSGTKTWSDAEDYLGIRPDNITVKLYADGVETSYIPTWSNTNSDTWTYTFDDIPMFYTEGANKGSIIHYTAEEVPVENYKTEYTRVTTSYSFTSDNITHNFTRYTSAANTDYTLASKTGINAMLLRHGQNYIVWTSRPITNDEKIVVTNALKLYDENNSMSGFEASTATWVDGLGNFSFKGNNWIRVDFKTDSSSNLHIESSSWSLFLLGHIELIDDSVYVPGETNITNTSKVTKAKVSKVWEDDNDRDGIQPLSVTVELLANNISTEKTLVLSSANNWKGTFEGVIDLYDTNGVEINYTIREVETNIITGEDGPGTYSYEYSGNVHDGFIVTNKHTPEKATIKVNKTWNDEENKYSSRPEFIIVNLYADDASITDESGLVRSVEIRETENGWTYTFDDIPKYHNGGQEIKYTITENSINDYVAKIDGYNITNTYLKTTLEITKEWVNYNPVEGDYIDLTINNDMLDKVPAKNIEQLTSDMCTVEGNTWKYLIEVLKYYYDENTKELTPINYSIVENKINGLVLENNKYYDYDKEYTNQLIGIWHSEINGLNIKNTWEEKKTADFVFKKVEFNSNNTPISGAVFRLYRYLLNDDSGTELVDISKDINGNISGKWKLVAEITTNDINHFDKLYFGEYRLIEVKAPDEYMLPDGQWKIYVKPDDASEKISVVGIGRIPALIDADDEGYLIPNLKVPKLPSTGGIGISNYDMLGFLVMMLGAIIYIINKTTVIKNDK